MDSVSTFLQVVVLDEYIKHDTWGGRVVSPQGSMFEREENCLIDTRRDTKHYLLSTLEEWVNGWLILLLFIVLTPFFFFIFFLLFFFFLRHVDPPWPLQRISEILKDPNTLYKTTRKLTFALDKLLTLSWSTQEDFAPK